MKSPPEPTSNDTNRSPHEPRAISPEDALPPVEPPTGGFILQLFIVPGLIVAVIVMTWFLFSWLARGTDDLTYLVKTIGVQSEARYQAAYQLASQLQNPRHAGFLKNPQAAQELAAILVEETDAASRADKLINLRVFLCRALGRFHVPQGIDALLHAATTRRFHEELAAQLAAIEAIAVRAALHRDHETLDTMATPQLVDTLRALAGDEDRLVRSRTAYTLALFDGPAPIAALKRLLDDPYPDARYNAAIGLAAHHGVSDGLGVLAEMLDPDQTAGSDLETDATARQLKQARMAVNALRAVERLAEQNPDVDLSPVLPVIEKLARAPGVAAEVAVRARSTLERLRARTAASGMLRRRLVAKRYPVCHPRATVFPPLGSLDG